MLRAQYIISIVVNVTDIRVLNFIIQFVSNVFNPSNIHVVGFQQSWICPYHSLSKNLHVNIWFLPYKFNTSLYNNCHSSRQPLFIVNPHFLPTRNIPLKQKNQSQSTSSTAWTSATVRTGRAWAWGRGCDNNNNNNNDDNDDDDAIFRFVNRQRHQ